MLQNYDKKAALFTLTKKKKLSCLVIALCWVRVETSHLRAKDVIMCYLVKSHASGGSDR